ncbi:MAG: hypothetical protein UT63_C0021G0009 [Candidatus Gottesmanbacteria bacterium GW2011_GWC2_39_8]|uniref:YprB ribonuclease H-like domain-containing protein n=1 Tax=Candidatus Gottesmanbacteria bacterium GW2011_GWC2_39_8 TaxID=1618450 RepID=A0A0G0Q7B1_9BACT|nr:MAG: hypothetical protein UT63_C0021G0009 [Candidatus Gottesmanbacteria bacterium GW2011_GWC2_39_8]
MTTPLVLDLETKYTFAEVGGDHRKLQISVVGIYDYSEDKYESYREEDLPKLFPKLEHAQMIVGYNVRKFDMQVLAPYYLGKIESFPVLDLIEEIEKNLGFRLALDDLARETLGVKKGGHGLLAINHFREGKWDELIKYCLSDVEITKKLYEYGKSEGKVFYKDQYGRREIKVNWKDRVKTETEVNLTIPL